MSFGTGILEKRIQGHDVLINGKNATISIEIPEEGEVDFEREDVIYTNPAVLLRRGALPSLAVVRFAKVKNFIDGVYATAEEKIAQTGHKLSRTDFVEKLEGLVQDEQAKAYMGIIRNVGQGTDSRDFQVRKGLKLARKDPSISLPQGFYDWTIGLHGTYSQIKTGAEVPGTFFDRRHDEGFNKEIMERINETIEGNPELKEQYHLIGSLYSKLTDKLRTTDCLFPPASLPDQEFFLKFSNETQSDIPQGLGKALVEAIKEKKVSFTPKKNSGFYTRQIYEIIPLVLRNTGEFEKFFPNNKYAEIMENEFISQWAGTRHTHVGHSPFAEMMIGACIDGTGMPFQPPIEIRPELYVEPISTAYERMAINLRFLRDTLTSAFGTGFLDNRRLLNEGGRSDKPLEEEFEEMDLLLRGLASLSKDSIHQQYKTNAKTGEAVIRALDWLKNAADDLDLDRNTAIFVPIIRTTDGTRQVSYINAGFKTVDLTAKYKDYPNVIISPERGHVFEEQEYSLPTLVHREVRIPYGRLINDKGLRDKLPESFTEKDLDKLVNDLEKMSDPYRAI